MALNIQVHMLAMAERQAGLVEDAQGSGYSLARQASLVEAMQGQVSQCEHCIASINCLRRAPQGPHCGLSTAGVALILTVVVNQREIVEHLHRSSGGKSSIRVPTSRLAGQQREQGT